MAAHGAALERGEIVGENLGVLVFAEAARDRKVVEALRRLPRLAVEVPEPRQLHAFRRGLAGRRLVCFGAAYPQADAARRAAEDHILRIVVEDLQGANARQRFARMLQELRDALPWRRTVGT